MPNVKACLVFFSLLAIYAKAQDVVPKKPDQPKVPISYDYKDEVLTIKLANPFEAPLRCQINTDDQQLVPFLKNIQSLLLLEKRDTILTIGVTGIIKKPLLKFSVLFGDLNKVVVKQPLGLPFLLGREYKVIQGNLSAFSHNDSKSRFALDFSLSVGDSVCAADSGVVVGLIQTSKKYGNSKKYINDANYITLYHPHTGLFTQYVHLAYQGAVVSVGSHVKKGEVIGVVGMSGFTDIAHLHFNVYKPTGDGWESIPIDFEGGYSGPLLKNGQWVKRIVKIAPNKPFQKDKSKFN